MNTSVRDIIHRTLPSVVWLRRELHMHPELGFQELETQKRILKVLQSVPGLAIDSGMARTGIVAVLNQEHDGPCVAFRAEMDALPIKEDPGKDYCSIVPGIMHACGHDGHTANLVGTALVLAELREQLGGPVKFIFQPAEETGGGGRVMVEAGVLEKPNVDAVFGLHGWPSMTLGTVGTSVGSFYASNCNFKFILHGKGTHAAKPHEGSDAVLAGCHIVAALQAIISRMTSVHTPMVLTVSKFHAGAQVNVIPESAVLEGTLRALDESLFPGTIAAITQSVTSVARAFQVEAECAFEPGYPVLQNNRWAVDYGCRVATELLGRDAVNPALSPSMGVEDFAYLAQQRPAAFFGLGLCPAGREPWPPLHNPGFDFNDDALPVGMALFSEIALGFSRAWTDGSSRGTSCNESA